ncbi:glutamate receptor ionotropic, kainate 1 isoform X10 [Drosophila santomea]|uniref:glutamate receptor ionotropic, kainate 1 isoform X10 n=1 Tax=Drosophila santomea TaxID=129105 RepID=UPI001953B50A|nr:glutamate receptor ionotropic, kainate 1 isoform X10 [Drosophila santomea]
MVRKKRETIININVRGRSYLKEICFSYIIFSILVIANALPPVIRVGAIFTDDERESSIESAFKYAIYRINKEKNLLPNTQLVYDIEYVPRDDSFRTTKKVCSQLEAGVQAIFGPTDALLASHVQSICEAYDIPHIEGRIDLEYNSKEFSINLYPSHTLLTLAYRDIMVYLNWTKVAIIYEEDYGLFNLMHSSTEAKAEMYIRQASPDSYRQVLRAIRQKEIYKIIVDTNPSHIKTFFRSILQLQMNDHRYHYMFTTFDLETYDLEDFRYNSVNITAFRLVDVDSKRYLEVINQMQKLQNNGLDIINGIPYIQTESALMFDSVYAFATGLHFLHLDNRQNLYIKNLSCTSDQTWNDGISLYNQINGGRRHSFIWGGEWICLNTFLPNHFKFRIPRILQNKVNCFNFFARFDYAQFCIFQIYVEDFYSFRFRFFRNFWRGESRTRISGFKLFDPIKNVFS